MQYATCTIRFYLNQSKNYRQGYPIYARILCNRKKSELTTGEFCQPEFWLDELERTANDVRTNEHLHYIKEQIIEAKRNIERSKLPLSANRIKEVFLDNCQEADIKLTDYITEHISQITQFKQEYTPGTVQHYKTVLKHLKAFLKFKKKSDCLISEFDGRLVNDFDFYLMTTNNPILNKPMNRNTVFSFV